MGRKISITHRKFEVPVMFGPLSLECEGGLQSYGGEADNTTGFIDGVKYGCGLNSTTATADTCVIFSVGNNGEWSFEEDIFKKTNGVVHTFDCTLGTGATSYRGQTGGMKVPEHIKSRLYGLNYCLGSKDEVLGGDEYRSWNSLIKISGVNRSPVYLKMDIEGHEFSSLPGIFSSGPKHMLPQHIAMEVHFNHPLSPHSFRLKAMYFNYLYRVGSYHAVHFFYNPLCFNCVEVLLARLCDTD